MCWPGAPIDLETVGWLELQLLLPDAVWEAGIRLADDDVVRSLERNADDAVVCVVRDPDASHDVLLTGEAAECSCPADGFCAHIGAALAVWIQERASLDQESAPALGALAGLPSLLSGIFRAGGVRARIEIDEGDHPDVLVDLSGEGGISGSLRLPPEHLSELLRMDAAKIDLGARLQDARRPDEPLCPHVHAAFEDDGAIRLEKVYRLDGQKSITRDRLEVAGLDGGWAWFHGQLHPIAPAPSALRRIWDGPDRIQDDQVFEFIRSELPALRRSTQFSAGSQLDEAHVIRDLQICEVQVKRQGKSHWFYLEPRYSAGELTIALDELRSWSAEGKTRVRYGNLWIELPSAAELARIGQLFQSGNRVPADALLQLTAEWEGRVRIEATPGTRELMERMRGAAPPRPVELPKGLISSLRGYQQEGFAWMSMLADLRLGGILADDMGLGKTHQSMALLAQRHPTPSGRASLVVCPRSVLDHWENKLREHAPGLVLHVHHGARRHKLDSSKADVWITTYDTLARDAETLFAQQRWELLLLDEAQKAKNVRTRIARSLRTIEAQAVFALTGTPIENTIAELWALFDLLLPGYLGTRRQFQERFQRPIEKENDPVARMHLGRLVRPLILRRLKSQVLDDLPDKIEDSRNCSLSAQQELLYKQVLEQRTPKIVENLEDDQARIDYIHILAALTKLKQICDHPALVLSEEDQGPDPLALDCGKFALFTELIDDAMSGNQKVVVFSQYLSMLDLMALHLKRSGIRYIGLRGSTVDRGGVIKRFQEDPKIKVFLASLMAGGLGIDLTAATVVIHYDRWWNPARENQATDRVHRIGQTRGVQVFRLITRGTIEDRIAELIAEKAALADGLIDSEVGALRAFSREELLSLLQAPNQSGS